MAFLLNRVEGTVNSLLLHRVEIGFAEGEAEAEGLSVELAPAALLGPFDGVVDAVAEEFGGGASREAFDGLAICVEHLDPDGADGTGGEIEAELIPGTDEGLGEHFAFLASCAKASKAIGAQGVQFQVTAIGSVVVAAVETEGVGIELHQTQ